MFSLQHWGHSRINTVRPLFDGAVVASATTRRTPGNFKGDVATSHISLLTPALPHLVLSHRAHPRGQPGSCAATVSVEPRPLVNPLTLERTLVEAVKTAM